MGLVNRKFGYVTLETTTGKLAKCITALLLLSSSFLFLLGIFFFVFLKGMRIDLEGEIAFRRGKT